MSVGPTYFCWRCYAASYQAAGECEQCGLLREPPPGVTYVDQLLWALRHPLPERRIIAARILGRRVEERALEPLLALAEDRDPYLAAAAVEALAAFAHRSGVSDLMNRLADNGPRRYGPHRGGHGTRRAAGSRDRRSAS